MVVVTRMRDGVPEVLVLHRRAAGPAAFDGDWAWTSPSGVRLPGEAIEDCAQRELREETGLELECRPLELEGAWALFVAEAPAAAFVRLDDEHDDHRWVSADDALALCRPAAVRDMLGAALGRSGAS